VNHKSPNTRIARTCLHTKRLTLPAAEVPGCP